MKKLSQLVPDIRRAIEEGVENTARQVTQDLKEIGPFWSGQFETLWQVNAGKQAIRPTVKYAFDGQMTPSSRRLSEVVMPAGADPMQGYRIGNAAEYRLIAMDVVPAGNAIRGDKPGATAPRDWYDRYRNGSGVESKSLPRTINREMRLAWRKNV